MSNAKQLPDSETPWVPAHELVPPGTLQPRVAFVLHGILGSGRNWRTPAKRLAERLPGWTLVLVDHRHHGDSKGAPPPHTIDACVEDLRALSRSLGVVPEVIVGHSFGGKVALAAAAAGLPGLRSVFALDSTPGPLPVSAHDDSEVIAVLRGLRDVPMPLAQRDDIYGHLERAGFSRGIAQWMTTNLERGDGGFVWRFDLDAAQTLIEHYFVYDGWPPIESEQPTAPAAHVVRAALSDRWTDDEMERFAALPRTAAGRLHTLENAGHWLHVDDPDGLQRILLEHWPL